MQPFQEIVKEISDLKKTLLTSVRESKHCCQHIKDNEHDELKQQVQELTRQVNQLQLERSTNEQVENEVTSDDSVDSQSSLTTIKPTSSDTEDWSVYEQENVQQRKTIENLETQLKESKIRESALRKALCYS